MYKGFVQHMVKHRNFEFDVNQELAAGIHGDPFRTQWLNALSTMFPLVEKFLIESVAFVPEVSLNEK